jgi:hypothetical protein
MLRLPGVVDNLVLSLSLARSVTARGWRALGTMRHHRPRPGLRAVLGGIVVAALLAYGLTPAAAGTRAGVTVAIGDVWSDPAAIIPNVSAATIPHLVMDAGGDAYVADSGLGAPLRGLTIAPDGRAGAPQELAPAAENPRHVGLGISSRGTVTAAYTAGVGRSARVFVRQAVPSAPPQQISPRDTTTTLISFQETPDGFAAALLCIGDQRHCVYALYARRGDGSRFQRVAALPAPARMAALAIGGDRAVVVWVDGPGSQTIRALEVRRNGRASPAVTVAQRSHIARFFPLEPAVVPDGAALVAWSVPQPHGRASLSVATRAAGATRFGLPRALTSGRGGHDTGESRLVASRGSVLLCTVEAQRNGPYRAVVRAWSPASGFSAARFASPASSDAFDTFAATGGDRTVVAWDGPQGIEATNAVGGSPFGAPNTLSDMTVQSGSGPFLAVDAHGAALAVWIDYGQNANGQVELARLPPP